MTAQSDIITPRGAHSRAARRLLRHEWQAAQQRDRPRNRASVAELLSDPAQAALAERQMSNQ